MRNRIILFIVAFFTWICLSWPLDPEDLVIGTLVGIIVSLLTAGIFLKKIRPFKNIGNYLWFFYYIILFIWECIKANLDGAYRVVHPDLPIRPGIVKVKTSLKSDTALTFLANTLTLKPGTMTIDIDKERSFLYVHWTNVLSEDIDKATEILVKRFERVLKRIFE